MVTKFGCHGNQIRQKSPSNHRYRLRFRDRILQFLTTLPLIWTYFTEHNPNPSCYGNPSASVTLTLAILVTLAATVTLVSP